MSSPQKQTARFYIGRPMLNSPEPGYQYSQRGGVVDSDVGGRIEKLSHRGAEDAENKFKHY